MPVVNSSEQPATPNGAGVFLLGAQGWLISLLLNPWLLSQLLPPFFATSPRRQMVAAALHVFGLLLFGVVLLCWRRLARHALVKRLFVGGGVGNWLLGLGTLVLTLLALEWVAWVVLRMQDVSRDFAHNGLQRDGKMFEADSLLGWRGVPGGVQRSRCYLLRDGSTQFDVTYHLDERGYRVVPQDDVPKSAHVVFMGCSFTFGDGCEDDETLPAQVACLRPPWQVHSFARPGTSPAQALLQLQSGELDHIAPRPGVAVFRFIPDHVNRLVPGRQRSNEMLRSSPYFQRDASGVPVYLGAMGDRAGGIIALNDFVCWLNVSQAIRLDTVVTLTQEHLELAVAILAAAGEEYTHRYPGNRFYVLIDPTCHDGGIDLEGFLNLLRARGILWLDPAGLYGTPADARFHFLGDGHPTPEAQALLAAWLVGHLDADLPTLR